MLSPLCLPTLVAAQIGPLPATTLPRATQSSAHALGTNASLDGAEAATSQVHHLALEALGQLQAEHVHAGNVTTLDALANSFIQLLDAADRAQPWLDGAAFDIADGDGDGRVSALELRRQKHRRAAKALLALGGGDGDGGLNRHEYARVRQLRALAMERRLAMGGAPQARADLDDADDGPANDALALVMADVRKGDRDGEGMLDWTEFDRALRWSRPLRHAVFAALDPDGDGRVDREPFADAPLGSGGSRFRRWGALERRFQGRFKARRLLPVSSGLERRADDGTTTEIDGEDDVGCTLKECKVAKCTEQVDPDDKEVEMGGDADLMIREIPAGVAAKREELQQLFNPTPPGSGMLVLPITALRIAYKKMIKNKFCMAKAFKLTLGKPAFIEAQVEKKTEVFVQLHKKMTAVVSRVATELQKTAADIKKGGKAFGFDVLLDKPGGADAGGQVSYLLGLMQELQKSAPDLTARIGELGDCKSTQQSFRLVKAYLGVFAAAFLVPVMTKFDAAADIDAAAVSEIKRIVRSEELQGLFDIGLTTLETEGDMLMNGKHWGWYTSTKKIAGIYTESKGILITWFQEHGRPAVAEARKLFPKGGGGGK